MRYSKKTDIFINVLLPLFIGAAMYMLVDKSLVPKSLNHHLADGVWAYAFQSCILIIWERKINIKWSVAIIASALLYECLQYLRLLAGTADIKDIFCYILFISLALLGNKFFKKKINNNYKYELQN